MASLTDISRLLPALTPMREYAPRQRSLADLLPYAVKLSPYCVLNKREFGETMTVSYRYRGPDLESESGLSLDYLATRVNEAIRRLDAGWMLQFHCDRKPAVGYPVDHNAFPDATSYLIDEERRADYSQDNAHFINETTLDITWKPPTQAIRRATTLLFEGEAPTDSDRVQQYRRFMEEIEQFEAMLATDLHLERLGYDTISTEHGPVVFDRQLEHFMRCLTRADHPLRALPPDADVSAALATANLRGGFRLRLGDYLITALSITDIPAHIYTGILDALNRLHCEHRTTWRFIAQDRLKSEADIERVRSNWFSSQRGVADAFFHRQSTKPNAHAMTMAQDAANAANELRNDLCSYGYFTATIILYAPIDRTVDPDAPGATVDARQEEVAWRTLQSDATTVRSAITPKGFTVREERENALEAFLGTLPAIAHANLRRPMLSSRNLADLLPITGIWSGEPEAPCPYYPPHSPALAYVSTPSSTPFFFNLHVRDVGHTMIVGPTGAGKSTLLGFLAAQHRRYPNARQVIFDVGLSHYALTLAVGGTHVAIGGKNSLRLCPLAGVRDPLERRWAETWLMELLVARDVPRDRYHDYRQRIYLALNYLARSEPPYSLTKFLAQPEITQEIREALEYYTVAGPTEGLLDAEEDPLPLNTFLCLEMGDLLEAPPPLKGPTLSYLLHHVERLFAGQPGLIELDEVWKFLDNPDAQEAVKKYLKTMRKQNVAVVFATQSVDDLLTSPIADTLIGSCPTKILLANAQALSDQAATTYRRIGVTDAQLHCIARAIPQREYFIKKTDAQRLIQLDLHDVSLAFIGVSDKATIATIERLIAEDRLGNPNLAPWQARWIAHRVGGRLGERWAQYWLNDTARRQETS